jgi:type II restriction/modification system DNA methylase subunit YeeA
MNTSALKTFAPAVRRQLMEAVTRKLDFVLGAQTPDYLTTFAPEVAALRAMAQADRSELIERVTYTWFNRLAALRFMDARGWHPFRARVLTPASASETQPELLKLTRSGDLPKVLRSHSNPARLNGLLDGRIPSPDAQGEVYRHLVLAACRFYHSLLPNVFGKLDDETELLLPDDLLTEHSVAHGFRTEISDEDCGDDRRANVEILGWLYQFYISERKDQVMARKAAVPPEDIAAVTQLFTPHWIVRYLVENTLGRLWLLNRPGSRLIEQMPYYIVDEAKNDFLKLNKPEEIRLLDPAVGSGHMLTYAFDLLYMIYEEEGYPPTEIPELILTHNLHGLEICPRAAQLAELALVFKAREKARGFFQGDRLIRPHILALRDVKFAEGELRQYVAELGLGELFNEQMLRLLNQFEEVKNVGSLIKPCLDGRSIVSVRRSIEAKDIAGRLFLRETNIKVLCVLEQAEALSQTYHVVVANPPYLGSKGMNPVVKDFLQDNFANYKSDLFAAFIVRSLSLSLSDGYLGFMSPFVWMFISSYAKLRERLTSQATITSLVQLEYSGFDGATVPICTFTLQNKRNIDYQGGYIRLSEFRGSENQGPRTLEAIANPNCGWFFRTCASNFNKIPGCPIAYWVSARVRDVFVHLDSLSKVASPSKGMFTGDNGRFLRIWWEISDNNCFRNCQSHQESELADEKWYPLQKGGEYRKWYGNEQYVINFRRDGHELKRFGGYGERSPQFYFVEALSWTKITSSVFSARYSSVGHLYDDASCVCPVISREDQLAVLGFLNSNVGAKLIGAISQTLNYSPGEIARLPFTKPNSKANKIIADCIKNARSDWDNFETSWDFCDHPLLRLGLKGRTLEASWRNWEIQSTAAIGRMRGFETENNRFFLAAYDLETELQPEVPEKQITLARAEVRTDIAGFLSYAVGCMMGRYSIDRPGLILANAGDSLPEFLQKVQVPQDKLTFAPDKYGIIPVLDGEWFEDDIVARTRDFLRVAFGEATLRANIRFIEESLGRELRSYFLTDFYKDHLQTYKKRPIYWMVQSPRKGFGVLLYLHRYTKDTINLVLNRYLRDYQVKLLHRLDILGRAQTTASVVNGKTVARQEADKLKRILHECEEWERQTVLPLAQARTDLDLDDGVKTNYLKLGEALAPIAGLGPKDDE